MSSFLYKKIWHGISIHTRKCIPIKPLSTEITPQDTLNIPKTYNPKKINKNLTNQKIIKRSLYLCMKLHTARDIIYLLSAYQIV